MVGLVAVVVGGYYYVEPGLPDAAELRNIEMQVPLSVYSRDGRLIAQFGQQKRTPIPFAQVPELVVQAFLAAEDDTFFDHPGIDFAGTARAIFSFVVAGGDRVPGGSTITQQVARQNFLTRDFSLARKFREWILAVRIEREFTKEEILELFLNTTFLGQQSYGVVAAARTYFDKELDELSISEAAIIAGIPQGPSILNPVYSPEAASDRRAYVLRRMLTLGIITQSEHAEAVAEPIYPTEYGADIELNAPYVAEMVRLEVLRRFGDRAYTAGLKVTTTVDGRLQSASNAAIEQAVLAYDERHGYRGALATVELPEETAPPVPLDDAYLQDLLADYPARAGFLTALVLSAGEESAELYLPGTGRVTLGFESVQWAREYISDDQTGPSPAAVADVLARGDVVRVRETGAGVLRLSQIPDVQGALVALDPADGAVVALNGGFNFSLDNFNRATQSLRQPGSSFKPFTFSAALEQGFTAATIVTDTALTLEETEQEIEWRPQNYTGKFYGEVPLREVLERSLNVASVRVVMEAGVRNVVNYLHRFGFDEQAAPPNLAVALGVGGVAPIDMAKGYATFANGGFRVEPYFIQRIEDKDGNLLFEARPKVACYSCLMEASESTGDEEPVEALVTGMNELYPELREAEQIISPQNAYLVTDMMRGVILRGTGRRALQLGRRDLAGKTGTTNEGRDTWFAGFNADLVAVSWVGFNEDRPLGRGEEGSSTALPMWNAFMAKALDGTPERTLAVPPGIVEVRINPETGLAANDRNPNAKFEKFRIENVPAQEPDTYSANDFDQDTSRPTTGSRERIF